MFAGRYLDYVCVLRPFLLLKAELMITKRSLRLRFTHFICIALISWSLVLRVYMVLVLISYSYKLFAMRINAFLRKQIFNVNNFIYLHLNQTRK